MDLQLLLTALIAFCATFTALGFIFNILLNPVKETLANFEVRIKHLEEGQDEMKADISEIKNLLLNRSS